MGISGLLPLLKSIQKPCSLKKFDGQTIGVDAYGWLHRGTAACAIELAQGKPTTKFVDFAMSRVRMLIHFGITPYIIFDGDYLPSKAGTEKERAARRREGKRLGLELLKVGKISQAQQELQKAVDVTPEMARMLIEELKHHNIQYVVAPFEADSQMVYLERKGIINGILSEDSDLLVFGAKCLITKLDKYGECVEINRNHFTACREVSLVGWTDADFRRMAILSGCDYLPGIGNMGLKTAYRMLRKHKTVERLIKAAQFDGKFKIPAGYLEDFYQAEKTFLYQWVFCPITKEIVHLTAIHPDMDPGEMPFIGEQVPAHVAYGVARGDLHPHTKQPLIVPTNAPPRGKPLRPTRSVSTSAAAQTPIGKQGKPIDSFFRSKRTPLAELDINLFTPSPSQQALLEQERNNPGWEAVPAPQQPPRTAPQPARRTISDYVTSRRSLPHPPKRQRLCTEPVTTARDDDNGGDTRSPFFAASVAEPSPSLRVQKTSKKKSRRSFELHSDDSIEDAINELVDLDGALSQPKKKMRIFSDSLNSSVNSDSQSSTFSRSSKGSFQDSQDSGVLTPATSFGTPDTDSSFNTGLTQQMKMFRSRFSYSSGSPLSSATSTLERQPSFHSTASSRRASSTSTSKLAKGNTRNESPELPDLPDLRSFDGAADEEPEVVVPASDNDPITPRKTLASDLTEVRGSEELLVPDSDAESICSPRKPLLNLGRFAFNG
ncbi:PIN domain-like protein [Periconia macrospinosa]|uniref:PIN domain-like protein n=1 Tax=Periconia macrospinosa TaxID=97972 RepID=A0A2V1D4P6_9PLEO|nr:PIN domain-like protein [Periconia macrospinosa]